MRHANAGSTRALGVRPEELVGRDFTDFVHPEDVKEIRDRLRGLANVRDGTGKRDGAACAVRPESGAGLRPRLAIAENNPAVDGFVASFLDVTALHRMEAERQVISEVVHALNQTANLDQLLDGIHQALKKVLYAENCFVALHDPQEDTFYFPFFVDQFDMAPPPQKGRAKLYCVCVSYRAARCSFRSPNLTVWRSKATLSWSGSPSPAWLGVPLKTPSGDDRRSRCTALSERKCLRHA